MLACRQTLIGRKAKSILLEAQGASPICRPVESCDVWLTAWVNSLTIFWMTSTFPGSLFCISMFWLIVLGWSCQKSPVPDATGPGPAPDATALDSVPDVSTATEPAIVFLGDSLTAGSGLDLADSVPALIEKEIRAAGLHYRVINAGRSGDTTADGAERLSWYLRPGVKARVFVIGLGSNDAMRGLSLARLEQNLRQMIRQIRLADPTIKIFLFEMKTFPNMGQQYAGAYERIFAKVAKTEKVTLLPFPLRGVAAVPRLNQQDGIHPNEEGTRLVARNVWRDLKPYL